MSEEKPAEPSVGDAKTGIEAKKPEPEKAEPISSEKKAEPEKAEPISSEKKAEAEPEKKAEPVASEKKPESDEKPAILDPGSTDELHDDDDDEDEDDAQRELEETIALATERLEKTPDDVPGLLFRGEALDDLGESKRARVDLEKAVALAPNSASAQLAWGRLLFGEDEVDKALEAVEKAISLGSKKEKLDPIDEQTGWNDVGRARASYLRAAIRAQRDLLEEALVDLDASLKLDSDDAMAQRLRGEIRFTMGDLEGALIDLKKAVAGRPYDAEARLSYAEALLEAGKIQLAYDEVNAAIEAAGDSPDSDMLIVRGEVRLAEGKNEEAKRDFAKAAELSPKHVEPRLGLIDVALATNDLDGAEKWVKEALAIDEEHPQTLVFKARVDIERGRFAEAEKACSKAIEIDAEAADAFALRAEARKKLGKIKLARSDAKAARALGFDVGPDLASSSDGTK